MCAVCCGVALAEVLGVAWRVDQHENESEERGGVEPRFGATSFRRDHCHFCLKSGSGWIKREVGVCLSTRKEIASTTEVT